MKEHKLAELVNELTLIAKQYADTQQLRDRISRHVVSALSIPGNYPSIVNQAFQHLINKLEKELEREKAKRIGYKNDRDAALKELDELKTQLTQAREDALEEAAKVADEIRQQHKWAPGEIAEAIRGLK